MQITTHQLIVLTKDLLLENAVLKMQLAAVTPALIDGEVPDGSADA